MIWNVSGPKFIFKDELSSQIFLSGNLRSKLFNWSLIINFVQLFIRKLLLLLCNFLLENRRENRVVKKRLNRAEIFYNHFSIGSLGSNAVVILYRKPINTCSLKFTFEIHISCKLFLKLGLSKHLTKFLKSSKKNQILFAFILINITYGEINFFLLKYLFKKSIFEDFSIKVSNY